MAIAKKPNSNTTARSGVPDDPRAVAFIAAADKPVMAPVPPDPAVGKTPVMVRFDTALLQRIDKAAKRRCISRSAWIQSTLSRALDGGEE